MVAAAEKVFAVKGKKYCVNSYTIFCRCFLYGVRICPSPTVFVQLSSVCIFIKTRAIYVAIRNMNNLNPTLILSTPADAYRPKPFRA